MSFLHKFIITVFALMLVSIACIQKTESPRDKRIRESVEALNLSLNQKLDILKIFESIDQDLKGVGLTRDIAKAELSKFASLDKTSPAFFVEILRSPLNKLADKLPNYLQQISQFYHSLSEEQQKNFSKLIENYFSEENKIKKGNELG